MPIISLVDVLFNLKNKLRNRIEKLSLKQKPILTRLPLQSPTLFNSPVISSKHIGIPTISSEPKTEKEQYADLLADLITYIYTLENKPASQIDPPGIPYANAIKHVEALYTAHKQERIVNDLSSMGLGSGSTNKGKNKSSTNEAASNANTTVETDFKIFKWSIEVVLAEIEQASTIKKLDTFSVSDLDDLIKELDNYISKTIQILLGATKHYNKLLQEYYDDFKTTFTTKEAVEALQRKFQENFIIDKNIIAKINEIYKNSLSVKQYNTYQQLRS